MQKYTGAMAQRRNGAMVAIQLVGWSVDVTAVAVWT
jgi:hypothetical protein